MGPAGGRAPATRRTGRASEPRLTLPRAIERLRDHYGPPAHRAAVVSGTSDPRRAGVLTELNQTRRVPGTVFQDGQAGIVFRGWDTEGSCVVP